MPSPVSQFLVWRNTQRFQMVLDTAALILTHKKHIQSSHMYFCGEAQTAKSIINQIWEAHDVL